MQSRFVVHVNEVGFPCPEAVGDGYGLVDGLVCGMLALTQGTDDQGVDAHELFECLFGRVGHVGDEA